MKKLLAIILVLGIVFALCACKGEEKAAGSDEEPKSNEAAQPTEPKGSTYDTGAFSVFVPEGWFAAECIDYAAEEPDTVNPLQLQLIKGGESGFDIFTHPYIHITYAEPDYELMQPQKEWYDNGADLEDLVTGSHTWSIFSATSLDYPLYSLWAEEDGHKYQVTIFAEQSEGTIELTDADVLQILSSIVHSK